MRSKDDQQQPDADSEAAGQGTRVSGGSGPGKDPTDTHAQEGDASGRMSSGSPREADVDTGVAADTGNTGGTGGAHGASTDNGGNAGVTVGNGGGPSEGTLNGEPPPRQTSDLIGTGGTLDDRPSSGTGNTGVNGGGADPDAVSVGSASDRGIPGARKA
ncbi:MAG TPA: hypothetical protein VGB85_01465 [Nannocystis sp.]|jgi:hypothetical protein